MLAGEPAHELVGALHHAVGLGDGTPVAVILAGGGTRGAETALQKLAESIDAPVVQTVNARGAMFGHRLVVPASPSLASVRKLIAEADQILAIGTELGPTDYDMYVRGGFPDTSAMIRIEWSTPVKTVGS